MVSRGLRLVTGLASLAVFFLIAALALSDATQGLDASLALAINNASLGASLSALMALASEYGREYFWIPVVAAMLLLGGRETKLLAIELALLFVVGMAFGEALKHVAYRDRPFAVVSGITLRLPGDTDSSFPSGHAIIVTIGAAFSLAKLKRRAVALIFALEAALVCYSRVYVGLHYPLDVLAGVALGVAIVELGLLAMDKYLQGPLTAVSSMVTRLLKDGPLHL